MKVAMNRFMQDVRLRMLRHLEEDILPYWLLPTMLGDPIGNFPTYADQNGVPDATKPRYVRMHGRQTYAYLAAYYILKRKELLEYGLSGLKRLKKYENPNGGYFSQVKSDGEILPTPITIQDQCYSVFPYIMAYRVTGESQYLNKVWRFIDFIDKGPYRHPDGTYCDSLMPDLKTETYFETPTMNIVSVIDFVNLILIPVIRVTPDSEMTKERLDVLIRWTDLLVHDFWGKGIFWNDKFNRNDWRAKHVDLGHTSKAYGILFKMNDFLANQGMSQRYLEIVSQYPELVKASSEKRIGWLTDFDSSATTFRRMNLQWWRHILIDQTVYHYVSRHADLLSFLERGVRAWFECDYIDRTRACRGIREGLNPDGKEISSDDNIDCKANLWKNAYHEVEHVLTFLGGEE